MSTISKSSSNVGKADPSHDVLRSVGHPLDAIFQPQSVAVIGASERQGSVGRSVMWNLLSSPFGGTLYPVNPKRSNILGVRAYKSIAELPERPDLVVVTTPADMVPGLIPEAGDAGVPAGIVISAGFKEHGEHGKQLEH
jgi:acetyltransferase